MDVWNKLKLSTVKLTSFRSKPWYFRYGLPILLIAFSIASKIIFYPNLNTPRSSLLDMSFIVLVSALYGGAESGYFATVLGSISIYIFFLQSSPSLNIFFKVFRLSIFLIQGFIISFIIEAKQQSDKQKDEFISFATHEIKNPLTTIHAYADILRNKSAPQLSRYAFKIKLQLITISKLLSDLLNLATIESGQFTYNDEEIRIYDLVRDIIKSQQLYTSHKIIFRGKTNKNIYADEVKIREVINNLISNAIKYSPKAKKIIIRIRNIKNGVVLSFQDFGIGIPREAQQHIFDKFLRSENAIKTGIKGLGIGLYICNQIVKNYHGRIWLRSRPQKGTTFFLSLKSL